MTIEIIDRVPALEEFGALAESVDWIDHFDWATIGQSLERSVFAAVALDGDRVAGTARVVGDGVHYLSVQDVMVRPDEADQGIATRLVQRLLDRVAGSVPADAVVSLFASPDAVEVYRSLGFAEASADPVGMQRTVSPAAR
jgi:GNAT superfamily N-acetyltransferase